MDIMKKVKIEALKKDITLTELANKSELSRENMYHHVKNKNPKVLSRIEKVLGLEKDFLLK